MVRLLASTCGAGFEPAAGFQPAIAGGLEIRRSWEGFAEKIGNNSSRFSGAPRAARPVKNRPQAEKACPTFVHDSFTT